MRWLTESALISVFERGEWRPMANTIHNGKICNLKTPDIVGIAMIAAFISVSTATWQSEAPAVWSERETSVLTPLDAELPN